MRNLIFALIFAGSASLYATDWASKDFTLVDSQKDAADTVTDTLKDKSGNQVTVSYTGELPENAMGTIRKLNSDFRNWTSMKVDYIKFSVNGDEIQILVSPSSYTYNNVNLLEHISTGILFTYHNDLYYNFRILVDKLFVPIKGIFIDERAFNEKILSAIKDPVTYINARDPEYLLERLEKLSVEFDRLRAAYMASMNFNRLIEKPLIDAVIDIKSKNPDFKFKEIMDSLRDQKIQANPEIVRMILRIYYNEF